MWCDVRYVMWCDVRYVMCCDVRYVMCCDVRYVSSVTLNTTCVCALSIRWDGMCMCCPLDKRLCLCVVH
jgi:hypothetical protein